jgi:hypothetical protein
MLGMDRTATYKLELHLYDHSTEPSPIVERALETLIRQGANIMSVLDTLNDAVARNKTVTDSAVTLLQGLKQRLDAAIASGDPAKVQALSDALGAETSTLADAVTANTPADPVPAPPVP